MMNPFKKYILNLRISSLIITREIWLIVKRKAMEYSIIRIIVDMKETGKIISLMDLEFSSMLIKNLILVNIKMDICMVSVEANSIMEIYIEVIFIKEGYKDQVSIFMEKVKNGCSDISVIITYKKHQKKTNYIKLNHFQILDIQRKNIKN